MDQKARMQELVKRLNETAHAYYVLGEPVISDMQWDAMYDELTNLERKQGRCCRIHRRIGWAVNR